MYNRISVSSEVHDFILGLVLLFTVFHCNFGSLDCAQLVGFLSRSLLCSLLLENFLNIYSKLNKILTARLAEFTTWLRSPLWFGHFPFFAIGYWFLLSIPSLSSFSFSLLIHLPLFVESFHRVLPRQPQSIIALFSFFIFWSASSRPSIRLATGAFPTRHS